MLLDLTVQGWLEELGERGPAPGGGSAAAVTASATVIRILRPRLARMSDSFVER